MSFGKFKEGSITNDKFYNTLTNLASSNKNHEHVLNVWKAFKIDTMKDYHDLYVKVDVLLLACVFEIYRKELTFFFFFKFLVIVGIQC